MICLLCLREKKTHWYYEDDRIWIADCLTCRVPMGVTKKHNASEEDRKYLRKKMEEMFSDATLDDRMRAIPDHYHVHAR